jgi:hypothetical protein
MDRNRQEQVIIALKEKGATQPCPRCRNLEFEDIGEALLPLFEPRGSPLWATAPEIPVMLISCTNYGYIAHHARRLLDLKR